MENVIAVFTPSSEALLGFWFVFALIGVPLIVLAFIYFVLAENNVFFTKAKENIACHVMKGNVFTGKVIAPSSTLYIENDEIKKFSDLPSEDKRREARRDFSTESFLGMSWIGMWPFYSLHYRRQQWQEWKTLVANGEHVIVSRDEQTPFLFINPFEYAIRTTEAEDKYGVPLTVVFTIIVAPKHATKPIFGVHDAYGQLQRLCIAEAIKVIKVEEFATFGATQATAANTQGTNPVNPSLRANFAREICALNIEIPDRPDHMGVGEFLGYVILDAQLNTVAIDGENKAALLKASTAKFVAKEEASAVVEKAKGDLERDKLVAEGQEFLNKPKVKYYDDISKINGAMEVETRRATPNVTTLVEGKIKPVLPINNQRP